MPLKETCRVEGRIASMRAYESGAFGVAESCRRHGITREPFYVWKRRRESGDARWFEELSRRPGSCPHATDEQALAAILALRERFPHFGPKTIKARLAMEQPGIDWPAASTIGEILQRAGLIEAKSRRRPLDQGEIRAGSDVPNG